MKISVLKTREPFDKIFIKTIKYFLKDFYKKSFEVELSSKFSKKNFNDNYQNWYCNPLINSIFLKNANPDIFLSINGEYKYNPSKPIRTLFQKIYLKLSQTKYFNVFLSSYSFKISPVIKSGKNKLIIGGNKKIRLIDIENKKVFVVLKQGFNKRYINREIFIRENFQFLSVPKLLINKNNNFWYAEEYVSGIPPNRLSRTRHKIILNKVISEIILLRDETKKTITVKKYLIDLNSKINYDLQKNIIFSQTKKNKLKSIINSLNQTINTCVEQKIFTSICHGDFHLGNILTDKNKYWLIDWENSCIRNFAYDLVIYLLRSRNDKKYALDILRIIKGDFEEEELDVINNWPEIFDEKLKIKKIYILIFLIEDLHFYIEENNNDLFYKNPNILNKRINEYDKILAYLSQHV